MAIIQYGLNLISLRESQQTENFSIPLINANITSSHPITKTLSGFLTAEFVQKAADIYELQQRAYPVSISSFRQRANIMTPVRYGGLGYNFSWTYPKSLNTGLVSATYGNYFSGFVPINSFTRFVQITKDSIVNRNTFYLFLTTQQKFAVVFLKAVVGLNASYSMNANLIEKDGLLYKNYINNYELILTLKKNWNRKYFITFSGIYNESNRNLPKVIKGDISTKASNFRTSLLQRVPINSQANIVAYIAMLNNNIFSPNKASFIFADVEINYKLKKKPLTITVKGENLTNQKFYFSNTNTTLSQTFYSIPLILRNIFICLRYEL